MMSFETITIGRETNWRKEFAERTGGKLLIIIKEVPSLSTAAFFRELRLLVESSLLPNFLAILVNDSTTDTAGITGHLGKGYFTDLEEAKKYLKRPRQK